VIGHFGLFCHCLTPFVVIEKTEWSDALIITVTIVLRLMKKRILVIAVVYANKEIAIKPEKKFEEALSGLIAISLIA